MLLIPLAALILLLPGLPFVAHSQINRSRILPGTSGSAAHQPAACTVSAAEGQPPGHPATDPANRTSQPVNQPATPPLADAIALSLALTALLGMASFFLGIRFAPAAVIAIYAACGIAALLLARRARFLLPDSQSPIHQPQSLLAQSLPLIIFALILAFRFYQARTLVLPAWVDSVHHTLLVRLFLETGGVPPTLESYLPVPLYYHFGFHANAALFAFFARLEPVQALLIFGQIINAAVPLAIHRLALALWQDHRRALLAMLLVGFVTQMPAYFVTWGRYTLLAGIILLAAAMAEATEGARAGFEGGRVTRLAILTSGLIFTHYFAALVFALYLAALVLERLLADRQFLHTPAFRRLGLAVGLGGLIALPWLGHLFQQYAAHIRLDVVPPTIPADEAYYTGFLDYLWFLLGPNRSHLLLYIGLAGLALLGWRKGTRPLGIFTLLFGLASLPWGAHLAPFRPDHGVILAFLPVSLFAADTFITPLDAFRGWWLKGLVGLAAGLLVWWGVSETRNIINPVTVLAGAPDLRALHWIDENAPRDAVFLINTAGWQGGSYRGVDGGWWIMPLTGRQTILPPALYLHGSTAYASAVNETARRAAALSACDDALWGLVRDTGATHAYIQFGVGALQPGALAGCTGTRLVYEGEGVYIFEFAP
jgi:hypothetical protein